MKTRRSWRNQDILFRQLFKPPAAAPVPIRPKTDEEIDAIPFLSKRTRAAMKREAARARYRAAAAKR